MQAVMSGQIAATQKEEYINELLDVVSLLQMSFERPSISLGNLKIIYPAQGSQFEAIALVQLDIGKASQGRLGVKSIPIYFVMIRKMLHQLFSQRSEFERIKLLMTACGIKLVNRNNVGMDTLKILKEIVQNRQEPTITNGNHVNIVK
eukprot:TRINITY_DN3020_c0_g1_i2.p2 TRINITY_DN3020_c0_g1~~TRINITY_DN3020_c0_g1_i2.p2  ORF type:complete len:148 (-),score=7.06 TRINITY_DN3020_c0_g1_i2:290-733(-)